MIDPEDVAALDATGIVLIGRAANEIVASLWKQALADEGIVALLKPIGAGPSFGTTALSEYDVYVREDQADAARAIVAELSDEPDSTG
ncbi:MAG: hypothetical protein DCC58_03665 [Chloroflexi bacterium]|nr:MAG: hypothetical protein DCC58_03665 [Chloroflexota bacterium]